MAFRQRPPASLRGEKYHSAVPGASRRQPKPAYVCMTVCMTATMTADAIGKRRSGGLGYRRFGTEENPMAITIRSAETDRLARELPAITGESITDAVTKALRERLARQRAVDQTTRRRLAALQAMRAALAGKEVADARSDDEITGYSEYGTFD